MVALGVTACIMAFPAAPTTDLGGPIVTSFADRASVPVGTPRADVQPPAIEDQAAADADPSRPDEATAVAVAPPAPVAVAPPAPVAVPDPTGHPDDDAAGSESRPATTSGPPDGTQQDGGSRTRTDPQRDSDGRSG